ncbi:MAG: ankyrin repeat domain-containing protein [Allosphingosinicella sp.]
MKFAPAAAVIAATMLVAAPAAAQNYSDGYTFLKAVKDRDGDKVTNLVTQPGSTVVNVSERTTGDRAVHIVTRDRDLTWLSFLIGKGARVDAQNNQGETPLTLASQLGWTEGAQLLLSQGAGVDLANGRGETPLILAVQRRDVGMVRLLLARGADRNRTDNVAGLSALDYAKRDARAAAVLRLLEAPPAKARAVAGPKL